MKNGKREFLKNISSRIKVGLIALILIQTFSCQENSNSSGKLKVVATTNIFTDLVQTICKDSVEIQGLMGAGVDPHLYKASEGDVTKLADADIIFYGGLHLEGKMVDIFQKMKSTNKITVPLGDFLDKNLLIESENFGGNYDPHIWFNVELYKKMADKVAEVLAQADPKNANFFFENNSNYQKELSELDKYIRTKIESLAQEKRILVTAHDAFGYFGKEYGFQVLGLQGISTSTEAGVKDVQRLRNFIIENEIKAIFIESSVPRRNIEALQNAVAKEGKTIEIGGSLFSDALGNLETREGTYIGMFKYNVDTIVESLK